MHELSEILKFIPFDYKVIGGKVSTFNTIDPIFSTKPNSLTWVKSSLKDYQNLLTKCESSIILCDNNIDVIILKELGEINTFIQTENPAVSFLRIVKGIYVKPSKPAYVHPTAIVHPDAVIGENTSIGAFTQVGNCNIGNNCIIESNSIIHDNARIGNNVLISEFCNIGGHGFGHILNENNILENMLHIGNVHLDDHVEVFPYTNIDRATLSTTYIGKHVKIDHHCHIGHNCSIEANTLITAKVVLCGGVKILANCFVGVGSVIRDGLLIGEGATIGIGSIITKNIPAGEIWIGNPGRSLIKNAP